MPTFSPDGSKQIVFNHYDEDQGHTLASMSFDPRDPHVLQPGRHCHRSEQLPRLARVHAGQRVGRLRRRLRAATSRPGTRRRRRQVRPADRAPRVEDVGAAQRPQRRGQRPVLPPSARRRRGNMNYDATVLPVAAAWVLLGRLHQPARVREHAEQPRPLLRGRQPHAGRPPVAQEALGRRARHRQPRAPEHRRARHQPPGVSPPGSGSADRELPRLLALDPCAQNGASCLTGDQCCSGYCRQTAADGGSQLACVPPQGCSNEYEKCTVSADCCQAAMGFQCINGFCAQPAAQ